MEVAKQRLVDSTPVWRWVFEHARRAPGAPAVDSPEHRLDYRTLAGRTLALARALGALDVAPGDRVVSALPHVPAAVVVNLAVEYRGGVNVVLSREWSPAQVVDVLAQTQACCLVLAHDDVPALAPLLAGTAVRVVVVVGAPPGPGARAALPDVECLALCGAGGLAGHEAAVREEVLPDDPPAPDPDRVTLLLYTSGSTGQPRAVMQTVRNIAANTESIVQTLGLTAADRAMLILPLDYCYGRSVLLTHLRVGGSVFLDPRFTFPPMVLEALGREGCTGFAGVPLTFELLRRRFAPDPATMPRLRYVTQAGGPMRQDTIEWARAAFRPAELIVMYGQTEATARLAWLPPAVAAWKPGSIGLPIPGVELQVVDDEGREVEVGTLGHLVVRGPNVTPGYFQDPAATAAILRDGALWTGDLARRDAEGFLFLAGRAVEMIKTGGHRVSPARVECVLRSHDDVEDSAVVGLPDALMGEAIAALVVPRPGSTLTARELKEFCGDRLPCWLVPRAVRLVAQLPRGTSGKVLRTEVVRALQEG